MVPIDQIVKRATEAQGCKKQAVLQSLWSGYGEIARYTLEESDCQSVVVKHVNPPSAGDHPRGWNTDRSHQRKLNSYAIETHWYQHYASRCTEACRVPRCLHVAEAGEEVIIVLEDLDASGFDQRRTSVSEAELETCIRWLAHFHATFMGQAPEGLWETGTYWHLATRPDELEVLDDRPLKQAAVAIDQRLKTSPFQTLVHGDAKLANFCFSADGAVAAVDFQYVGGGCGMKDLAYFIGSCLYEEDCAAYEDQLLQTYFTALREALARTVDADALEADWRALYPVAWTDFHRFLKGWSPGHWKINSYSERLAREVIANLGSGA